ncbi:phage tail sheath subtilisin-like domain-containing protein [Comamonas sp. J-3]|uniref:phage tail sheath subtilisin-like domain-containing protein n=1 Tax=Comamonas trifloxystrobinivorans TaxID=3350256 RepID=UPI00372B9D3F
MAGSLAAYHHGVRVVEVTGGTAELRIPSTAVIGLVATAPDADEAVFPLNKPVLFTSISKAQAAAGTTGTLSQALGIIASQVRPVIVVVRVDEGEGADDEAKAADQTSKVVGDYVDGKRTGVQALLDAKAQLGVKPRILGAPGLDTKPVADALASVAEQLKAMSYVYADGAKDVSAALAYAEGFGKRETMVIWPNVTQWDTNTNANVVVPAVAYALGARARIDTEQGWHKTISNVEISGPTGLEFPVFFDLQNPACDTTLLNEGNVTTWIRQNGFRLWGSRTCSLETAFRFESAVRTAHVLADTMADGHFEFIDKPMHPSLVKDILEGINSRMRSLKAGQYIMGGRAWLDTEVNTTETLKVGKLTLDYEYTPIPPLEDLGFIQRLTDTYWGDFAQRVATGQ